MSYNWLFWSFRYPGLLLSGLGVLVSLPLLLWPGALFATKSDKESDES